MPAEAQQDPVSFVILGLVFIAAGIPLILLRKPLAGLYRRIYRLTLPKSLGWGASSAGTALGVFFILFGVFWLLIGLYYSLGAQ